MLDPNSTPPYDLDKLPTAGDLIGHVNVAKSRCADGSYTLRLRWREWDEAGLTKSMTARNSRTGPDPTRRDLADAIARARMDAREMEEYIMDGRPVRGVKKYPLRDGWANYLEYLYVTAERSTYDRRESQILRFVEWHCHERPRVQWCSQVITSHVQDYLEAVRNVRTGLPLKGTTLRTILSDISSMFAWFETKRWCEVNPCAGVRLGPRPKRKPVVYLPNERAREVVAGDSAGAAGCAMLFGAGFRIDEAATLCWRDVHLDDRLIVVPEMGPETNKGHQRFVPMGPGLQAVMRRIRGAGVDDLNSPLIQDMDRVVRKHLRPVTYAGQRVTSTWGRRWYLSALTHAGAPKGLGQLLIGHTVTDNVGYYLGLDVDGARKFIDVVDAALFG